MKRARFKEELIIAVLRKRVAGAKAVDLARKPSNSEASLYNSKAMTLLGWSQFALRRCTNRGP